MTVRMNGWMDGWMDGVSFLPYGKLHPAVRSNLYHRNSCTSADLCMSEDDTGNETEGRLLSLS